jgi:hypothetical protein
VSERERFKVSHGSGRDGGRPWRKLGVHRSMNDANLDARSGKAGSERTTRRRIVSVRELEV